MNSLVDTPESVTAALWIILGLLVLLNIAATRRIVLSGLSDARQKLLQAIFVWLVPVIGAATVYAVLRESSNKGSGRYASGDALDHDPNVDFSNSMTDYFNDEHHGS